MSPPVLSGAGGYTVTTASWDTDRADLMHVRRRVFIDEQRVPEALEWDDDDAICIHVLAWDPKRDAVGTARLHPSGRVGRVAVLKEHRGSGVGMLLMTALISLAGREEIGRLVLHSQVQALGFYRRLGFVPFGEEFLEAGIAHIGMQLTLK
ncbi:MAG: GNAT family N-acetyltransferase [Gammaproteobacteria bacterium]|nr:GNAT family N-acetyltransferase [Gammaproteobacteria bacterium]